MSSPDARPEEPDKPELSYREAAAEIERTLEEIEKDPNVDIDELADRVERASELIQFCLARLEHAELRVRKVTEKLSRAAAPEGGSEPPPRIE